MNKLAEQTDRKRQLLAGRILLTVGVLIIFATGSCSIYFGDIALSFLFDRSSEEIAAENIGKGILSLVLIIGGIPLLLGVFFVYFGRKTLRNSRINSNPPDDRM